MKKTNLLGNQEQEGYLNPKCIRGWAEKSVATLSSGVFDLPCRARVLQGPSGAGVCVKDFLLLLNLNVGLHSFSEPRYWRLLTMKCYWKMVVIRLVCN